RQRLRDAVRPGRRVRRLDIPLALTDPQVVEAGELVAAPAVLAEHRLGDLAWIGRLDLDLCRGRMAALRGRPGALHRLLLQRVQGRTGGAAGHVALGTRGEILSVGPLPEFRPRV